MYIFFLIIRLFFIIFEINLQDTFTHFEKYSSKLDISHSFIRIFAANIVKCIIILRK